MNWIVAIALMLLTTAANSQAPSAVPAPTPPKPGLNYFPPPTKDGTPPVCEPGWKVNKFSKGFICELDPRN